MGIDMTEAMGAVERKQCEQCKETKDMTDFRKVVNQYTSVHFMSICRECYNRNLDERKRRLEVEWEAGRERREAMYRLKEHSQEWEEGREEREEQARQREQEQLAYQQSIDAWYQQQPDRECIDCKQVLPATAFGYSMSREVDDAWFPDPLHRRCKPCHEAYRKGNRQVYPLCLLCGAPAPVYDFLREYRGFRLDCIKVCCKGCILRFEALPEPEQMELLRRAIKKAYGETASVYGLHYDETGAVHHIGRTKHLQRRMAEYRRNWYHEITMYHVFQELPFGGLSMEYESRWMLHALKRGWPIDNFDILEPGGISYENAQRAKAELTSAVADLEPLIEPFETIKPLIVRLSNTGDMHIVHWFLEANGELTHILETLSIDDCSVIRP
jgi:hypothetical protein